MKIETQPLEDHQIRLTVELDNDATEKYMRKAARQISKGVRIPGFRPGKAPFDVISRHFGEKAIEEQAVELLLEDIYPEALKEAKLDPSGAGKLEEYPSLTPPVLKFIVPLMPEIQLGDYQAIRKDYQPDEITDDDVNKVLNRIRLNNAIAEPVEDRAAQKGDQVYITLSARFTKTEDGEEEELVKEQPLQVIIEGDDPTLQNEADEAWPYSGFSEELVGLSTDDEKTVTYSYPEDSAYDKLQGKEVEFSFKVDSIKALQLPEVDNELAQSVANFESADELVEAVRKDIEAQTAKEYEQEYMNGLIDEIVEQSTIKYPPHYLEEETQHVLNSIKENLARQRLDLPTYLKTIDSDEETFIENEVTPIAIRQLEQSLVLQEIMKEENITLEDGELQSAVAQTVSYIEYAAKNKQLPPKTRKDDMIRAATFETANRLLNQHLMERLKAIANGETEKSEEPDQESTTTPVDQEVEVSEETSSDTTNESDTPDSSDENKE